MSENIQKEIEMIKESVLQTVPDTEAIYLFGSYAYGAPSKDSDLDVYVVIPDTVQKHPLNVGVEIREKFGDKQRIPLDLIVGKSSVFKRRKACGGTIQKTIASKGVLLYGQ